MGDDKVLENIRFRKGLGSGKDKVQKSIGENKEEKVPERIRFRR